MIKKFEKAVEEAYDSAKSDDRLVRNPDSSTLRELTFNEPGIRETRYGSLIADSEPTSRAAVFTENNVDSEFGRKERRLLRQMKRQLSGKRLISLDFVVGDGSDNITARLMVPEDCVHVAYGATRLFPQAKRVRKPTHTVAMFFDKEYRPNKKKKLPDKDITIRVALFPDGRSVKIVRNSNYFGEWKKGVFTGEDWRAKQGGKAIFLHAGCRQDFLQMTSSTDYKMQNSLFVALSANGKTSTTCKTLARKPGEQSWLIQDDGGTLTMDGEFKGFEGGGIFVKTEKLNPRDQIETYYGCLRPETFLENVHVDERGEIGFYNLTRTANGRAIIRRKDFMHASKDINVERVHNLFIITRGGLIPAVAKLTPKQAAAFMVLGQSMESSAGDPTQAGKIKNVFFYDPFVAGNRAEHANLFYEIIKSNRINCYLINTGGIGEGAGYQDIRLQDTMGILDSVLRGGLEDWVESRGTGLMVPKSMIDPDLLHPRKHYSGSEFKKKQKALNRQRKEVLEKYSGLDRKISSVF